MKNLIFLCIASAILLFSIVTINIAPIIGGLEDGNDWMKSSCKYSSDIYDNDEKRNNFASQNMKELILKKDKKDIDRCNRKQAMVALEYISLNINIFIGFICAFLGLLHYLNLGNLGKIPGLIGLGGGVVALVLTFVYVIESSLVFDDIVDNSHIRIDSDGAFLEWDTSKNKYTCIFYDKDDLDSVYLKYSDYGNSYLNYRKDITFIATEKNYLYKSFSSLGCNDDGTYNTNPYELFYYCKTLDESSNPITKIEYYDDTTRIGECDKIYHISQTTKKEKKIEYDRWLTSIILSCFIFLFNIGLAIFGFLLFRESSGSSGSVAIK